MTLAADDHALARGAMAAPARWEPLAAAFCLAQFSEPLFAAIAQAQGALEPPDYARWFFLPAYGFLAFAAWRDRAQAWAIMRVAPLLLALFGLALASTLWSIDPSATLRRSAWLGLTMLFAFYLAWRYSWQGLVQVLARAFLVLIAGSFVLALLAPDIGRMTAEHPGAWSGLWTHKNTLGGIMALAVAVCAAAAWVSPQRRMLWSLAALGAFTLVLLSTSKTALVATLLALGIMGVAALQRRGPIAAIAALGACAVLLIMGIGVLALTPELLVELLGRDLTLTGRTDIWQATGPAVAARPWLGYGYYAFWLPDAGPAYWVREAVGWKVASAHSSWLELSLGLGRAGIAIFALQTCTTLMRGVTAMCRADAGLWAPALLAVFALYTLSESHALQANNLFWIIYVTVAARLALDARTKG